MNIFLNREVLPVALGTWVLGGCFWGGAEVVEIADAIHKALDEGVRVIDTAPLYGFGRTEEIVGDAIRQYGKRDQVILCTKFGLGWRDQKIFRDARKKTVLKEAEASLRRLRVDSIDLYQLHWPDPLTPISETAEALYQLLEEGKIRAVGLSNFTLSELEEFQKYIPIQAIQPPYNLFERGIENGEIPYCKKNHISILGYGTLCRGMLSGNMEKSPIFRGDDLRSFDPKYKEPLYTQYLSCIKELKLWIESKHRRSLPALAFRYVLDHQVVALWGPKNLSELSVLKEIEGWKLNAKDFEEIDQIIERHVPSPLGIEFLAPPCRGIGE